MNLKVGNPEGFEVLCQIPGGAGLEAHLHEELKAYRVSGEWFAPSDEVFWVIERLKRFGVPSGKADASPATQRSVAEADREDVAQARELLIKAATNWPPTENAKSMQSTLAALLGWSERRVRAIWERDARRISSWEMKALSELADEAWLLSPHGKVIADMTSRISALELALTKAGIN